MTHLKEFIKEHPIAKMIVGTLGMLIYIPIMLFFLFLAVGLFYTPTMIVLSVLLYPFIAIYDAFVGLTGIKVGNEFSEYGNEGLGGAIVAAICVAAYYIIKFVVEKRAKVTLEKGESK